MVGTLENATTAAAHYFAGMREFVFSNEGSTRAVYLIEDVIYKVNEAGFECNESEFDNIRNPIHTLPRNVFYPEVSLYNVDGNNVLAMDYIEGEPIYQCFCDMSNDACDNNCMTPDEVDLLVDVMDDPSGMNVIRTYESTYYIIDVA